MNSNIMARYSYEIYLTSDPHSPVAIDEHFFAAYPTMFQCVDQLKPGNSMCFFRYFSSGGEFHQQCLNDARKRIEMSLMNLAVVYRRSMRSHLWTISVQNSVPSQPHIGRVIANIVRVT